MGLLGKLTGSDAANKAAKGAAQKAEAQKQAALGELTPESFQSMLGFFLPMLTALTNPAQQTIMQGLKAAGSKSGALARSGVFGALQGGVPGQFALGNLGKALGITKDVQTQRAGIISGSPIMPNSAGRSALGDIFQEGSESFSFLKDVGGAIATSGKPNPTA